MKRKGVFFINNVPQNHEKRNTMEVDLEEALDLAGVGRFQVIHCALMLATLTSAILEMIGNAFILPAAACDLDLPESLRGIITSIPNIGIILTAPLWGRVADSFGRKPALLVSTAAAGLIGFTASFMPSLTSYALCKFAGSLFLACPSSLGYAYAGELMPRRRRDLAVMVCNGLLMMSSVVSPLFSWGILSGDWRYQIGSLTLRPWRLLTAVHALPLLFTSFCMTQARESPKFLMAKGKPQMALEVLRHIYARNSRLPPDDYCVTSLKVSLEEGGNEQLEDGSKVDLAARPRVESPLNLLGAPHLKWLALTGFLMFGLFSLLNGLFLFAPATINKVMSGPTEDEGTVCIVMNQLNNQTASNATSCVDTISRDTFLIMVSATLTYGTIVMAASLCPVSKKLILVTMFTTSGVACLMSGLLANRMVAVAAMSALQLTSLGIGPLSAYAVHLFPTNLRGTAAGAVLMCGCLGSVVGANVAGAFLPLACTATFLGFTSLLFLCAALSFLLPKDQLPESSKLVNSTKL